MTRQVTDQLYIDLEYYNPEQYLVYVANAQIQISVTSQVFADTLVIPSPYTAFMDENTDPDRTFDDINAMISCFIKINL